MFFFISLSSLPVFVLRFDGALHCNISLDKNYLLEKYMIEVSASPKVRPYLCVDRNVELHLSEWWVNVIDFSHTLEVAWRSHVSRIFVVDFSVLVSLFFFSFSISSIFFSFLFLFCLCMCCFSSLFYYQRYLWCGTMQSSVKAAAMKRSRYQAIIQLILPFIPYANSKANVNGSL